MKPLPENVALKIENLSLKLHIAKRTVSDMERQLQQTAKKALIDNGLSEEEYIIDIDKGAFVPKPKAAAATQ